MFFPESGSLSYIDMLFSYHLMEVVNTVSRQVLQGAGRRNGGGDGDTGKCGQKGGGKSNGDSAAEAVLNPDEPSCAPPIPSPPPPPPPPQL